MKNIIVLGILAFSASFGVSARAEGELFKGQCIVYTLAPPYHEYANAVVHLNPGQSQTIYQDGSLVYSVEMWSQPLNGSEGNVLKLEIRKDGKRLALARAAYGESVVVAADESVPSMTCSEIPGIQ